MKEQLIQLMKNQIFAIENQLLKQQMLDYFEFKSQTNFPFAELVVSHYKLFGGVSQSIIKVAYGVELMILSFDIFDDIEDQDCSRAPWNNSKPELALNTATVLFHLSHMVLDKAFLEFEQGQAAKELFNQFTLHSINGQHQDLQNTVKNEQEYFEVTKRKSGALVSLACSIGTVLANDTFIEKIIAYGYLLGITSQIQNDIEDVLRNDEKNDLLYKKKTLPTIYLLNDKRKDFKIVQDYYKGIVSYEAMKEIQQDLIEKTKTSGAVEYANVHLYLKQQEAIKLIEESSLPQYVKEQLIQQVLPNQ
ncbi:MAG TPA: hypothetical protein GX497_11185 [Bacillus bacterium]|nr:hypothetical protein [Bacillus sp. (in: firmicutes)]